MRATRAKTTATPRTHDRPALERLEGRQFYSTTAVPVAVPAGSAKLTGAPIGTAGAARAAGGTLAKAFDGSAATFASGPRANAAAWAGLDLGAARVVTQVQYVPRAGSAGRMVGGVFQGSDMADFSADVVTLATVTAKPVAGRYAAAVATDATPVRYVRYLSPAGGFGNVAELEFDGRPAAVLTAATAATAATPVPTEPTAAPVATSAPVVAPAPAATPTPTATVVDATTVVNAPAPSTTVSPAVGPVVPVPTPIVVAVPVATVPPATNPWGDADVGAVGLSGGSTGNADGTVTVTGGGADVWGTADAFHFTSQQLVGNGSVTARVTAQANSNVYAKAGVMVRESGNVDARSVLLALTPGGYVLQARTATHTNQVVVQTGAATAGVYLRIARAGSTFTGLTSADGATWTAVGSVTIALPNNVLAGLAVTGHDNTLFGSATFANVAVAAAGTEASSWTAAAAAPAARWEAMNVTYGGKLYVFGGLVDRSLDTTAECNVYDPKADAWQHLTTIPTGGLTHAAAAVVGDTVYLAGGDGGTLSEGRGRTTIATVLSYNFTTGAWGTLSSLPSARACGGMVAINNHLIYYGGVNGTATADLTDTLSLDLANPSAGWAQKAAMPDARDHMGAAVVNGVAYAVGGTHLYQQTTGNDAEVDAYDPVADRWTRVASLPMAWGSLETSTVVVNDKIVIVGGQTNGGYDGVYLSTVAAYDPTANTWSTVAVLPEASQSGAVAAIGGQLIVTGGTVDNQGGWAQNQTWVTGDVIV